MNDLYETFKQLNIQYEEIEHEPIFTIEEAKAISRNIEGKGCKSLFLKNKKRYYLVLMDENKRADIKGIAKFINESQLSFASEERLKEILGLERGSVTPLGIINDEDNKVLLIIDDSLRGQKLLVHPNTNTKTLSIAHDDLIKFIEFTGHRYLEICTE